MARSRVPGRAKHFRLTRDSMSRRPLHVRSVCGFTLIELLVVLAIVALLLTLSLPRYFTRIDSAKESILADNLRNTRAVIDQYHADTGRYPDSLEQLVGQKYLPAMPVDPISESSATWIIVPPEDASQGGVYDLHSGAQGNGRNGRPYQEW